MELRPNIYEYLDYRLFLKAFLAYRKKESAAFSYRSFSRMAGFRSPNFLKLVIDGERNISLQAIPSFAKAFKLTKTESDFFENLVLFNQAKIAEEKNRYYERISRSKSYHDAKPLEASQYAYFSNWYFVALRELVLLKNFKEDPRWINKKLKTRTHPDEIKRALRILIELKLLYRDGEGRLRQTVEKISTSPEMGALAVLNFHREMLKKAQDSLENSRTSDRDISALTVAVSKKQFERIKERLQEIRREIHAISAEPGEKESVYQINLQMFNLSEVPWA